jgi:UDP-N-acetylmuramyl-tripeptide synthetase
MGAAASSQPLASVDAALAWLRARGARRLATDSRKVEAGDAFIAWPGYAFDARQFAGDALAAGAVACLVEARGVEPFAFADERIATLPGLKAATGELASRWFGEPTRALDVIAITGTNGKTSSAWWTAQALALLGRRAGVIGTLGAGEPPLDGALASLEPTGLTTPDPVTLQAIFRRFADAGHAASVIEASSIGIVEERLAGTRVAVAVFTNFTRDHLDYHGTMEGYWEAKERLFAWPGLRAAVLNIDDEQGAALAAKPAPLDVWTCSSLQPARLRASDIGYRDGGLAFEVHEAGRSVAVRSALIGEFNVSNLLAVIGALRALGVTLDDAASTIPWLGAVPGRMQRVDMGPPVAEYRDRPPEGAEPGVGVSAAAPSRPASAWTARTPADSGGGRPGARARLVPDRPQVVVDYAHTPDALGNVLKTLRELDPHRLIAVFGCGGNRDRQKRPLMAEIVDRHADYAIITSDNPRKENPDTIISEIEKGFRSTHFEKIVDRTEAINRAIELAKPRDIVLIAGKGHENYQEFADHTIPFDDIQVARRAIEDHPMEFLS